MTRRALVRGNNTLFCPIYTQQGAPARALMPSLHLSCTQLRHFAQRNPPNIIVICTFDCTLLVPSLPLVAQYAPFGCTHLHLFVTKCVLGCTNGASWVLALVQSGRTHHVPGLCPGRAQAASNTCNAAPFAGARVCARCIIGAALQGLGACRCSGRSQSVSQSQDSCTICCATVNSDMYVQQQT